MVCFFLSFWNGRKNLYHQVAGVHVITKIEAAPFDLLTL